MSVQPPSMLTAQVIRDGLSYLLRGKLRIKNAHLPPANHTIPKDFIGVCVASNEDPLTDDYVIAQLCDLGITEVRLDMRYDDLKNEKARFLKTLIANHFNITLHLVQPIDAAKKMLDINQQTIWQQFIQDVLNAFGEHVKQIEIGTTINRRRWCGYTQASFLATWDIAYRTIKAHNIKLVGPNIQDFEPIYNISLLKRLNLAKQLPDIVSNNLFCERVNEPESFDHRVFKYQWTHIFRYNLIKKARILKKISQDFGVNALISPVAFWAVYRIERRLVEGAQKQADYAARYFLLLAASNSLNQANWGAFICQREGLIDDGLIEADYPALERVAYYKNADGMLANYRPKPSFNAVKTVAKQIQNARYIQTVATGNGLEIHHFEQGNVQFHAAWTINGKAVALNKIYDAATLNLAKILHRDGLPIQANVGLVTESPIYLIWDKPTEVKSFLKANFSPNLSVFAHISNKQYFQVDQDGWQGLVLAKDAEEAQLLIQTLHPVNLKSPAKEGALRHARNAIWAVPDPRNESCKLTIKQPIKMYPHKAFLDRFKPSKAKRSWHGAMELMRRGIDTAQPVAYFEKIGDRSLKQNFYICDFVISETTIGQIFTAFANGETTYLGLTKENIFQQFALFCNNMHTRLVFFRDFSGGNILVNNHNGQLSFSLIDTARLRTFNLTPFPVKYRIADLTRACHKLDWPNRTRMMQIYLGLTGRQFSWQHQLSFYIYDIKVGLKRRIGRKGIKRLIRWFKGA